MNDLAATAFAELAAMNRVRATEIVATAKCCPDVPQLPPPPVRHRRRVPIAIAGTDTWALVLASDGTLWTETRTADGDFDWQRLPDLPQGDA